MYKVGASGFAKEDLNIVFAVDHSGFMNEQDAGQMIPKVLRSYETDEIRYLYAPYYHGMAKEFIRDMITEIVGNGDNPTDSKEQEQVVILFGEYMGEADVLCRVERKKMDEIFQYLCGQTPYTAPHSESGIVDQTAYSGTGPNL